ncbi:hypothetical protein CAC42_2831 [Sphaceloma murrayae]|uniref:C6 finger domain protein n=1 Tax=Sphaceloma murrayae TaxID=2082308 RepID=A0A2K1R0Z0_9PEZI|nr:hypothetical protein CAC42_2831 [Sphaceloma murrayae]
MDNLDFSAQEGLFSINNDYTIDSRVHGLPNMPSYLQSGWPLTSDVLDDEDDTHNGVDAPTQHQTSAQTYSAAIPRRHNTPTTSPITLQQTSGVGLGLAQNLSDPSSLLQPAWHFQYQSHPQQNYSHDSFSDSSYDDCSFAGPFASSPVHGLPMSSRTMQLPMQVSAATNRMGQYLTMAGPMESMGALAYPLTDYQSELMSFPMTTMGGMLNAQTQAVTHMQNTVAPGGSPSSSTFEVCSLASSDNGWTAINFAQHGFGTTNATTHAVFNPGETLHIRADSNSSSDGAHSDQLSGSYEDMPFPMHSPISEHNTFDTLRGYAVPRLMTDHHHHSYCDHDGSAVQSPEESPAVSPSSASARPVPNVRSRPLSSSSSSISSTGTSPPLRRRRSPTEQSAIAKTTKPAIKKADSGASRKSAGTGSEKRVGRRRGPLRPDQRQQAHEIRKLRACLRCKFLKKTCDKGDPCAGCRPSHARLWQVPCTRIDIKDIGFFINDWEYDYKRHVTLGVSVNNVKGFSQKERTLYITHGFGYFLPITAREVYVADENCFEVDWIETANMTQYEASTSKLSTGIAGVSASKLSEYIDMHLDDGFNKFVDQYFEGTPFLTQILHTAYKYYTRTQTPVIRKALKLILAYNLTLHITMVVGMSEEEQALGRIDDDSSRFSGKTVAPVMINFEVKCALAKMWRELQKDVLEELSGLYSSVYQGDKLRNWPTIFMVASILLAVWELMQFDCHFREPDENKVDKFCNDMESTPVGVIVGLFQAISQKLPSFMEWDSSKHAAALNNDEPICDAMTEVRSHVEKHETYLRSRPDTIFTRDDFDSLSNKFLSKLVIRAN